MKIQIGRIKTGIVETESTDIHPNKTRLYLLPCLKEYGTDFMFRLNNVYKVAAGIGDKIVDSCGIKYEKHLFILVDSTKAQMYFNSFIEWIKDQSMYEDDYVFGNIQKTEYHMIILKVPEKFHNAYQNFTEGKYSKMYEPNIIVEFFLNPSADVLLKSKTYVPIFVRELNKIYNTTIKHYEWEGELDLPPTPEGEVFNHHLK